MIVNIKGYDVLIDDEDYGRVSQHIWRPNKPGNVVYFMTNLKRVDGKQPITKLHRFLMGCTPHDGTTVDHINHDTLDNRKCNLRLVSPKENAQNRSLQITNTTGYKGVSYYSGIYNASIGRIYIGSSCDPVECAKMYDMMAIKLYEEYACINFNKNLYAEEDINLLYNKVINTKHKNNTSGYIGVTYKKYCNKWEAKIYNKNTKKCVYLGLYTDPINAAKAYDKALYELKGRHRKMNFPEEPHE